MTRAILGRSARSRSATRPLTGTDTLFSVKDRVVVITGGLGQLGRQFASALLARGAKVALWDARAGTGTAKPVASRDRKALHVLQVDVADRASLEQALAAVVKRWGPPHALVNNAALDAPPSASAEDHGPFEQYPERSWEQMMAVNAKGPFLCCQVVGAEMAKAHRGTIINISSIYGLVSPDQRLYAFRRQRGEPFFKPAAYGASKAALVNLTRYLATYWAPQNIRVNALTFGGVFNHQPPELVQGYSARVPLGRMAREDEYNGALVFLISDASSYMTGSNVVIDGGWTAW